jgi:hypothetical protein
MRAPKRHRSATPAPSTKTMGDFLIEHFMAKFNLKPSATPFHTTAQRKCGRCKAIKPGAEFDVPVAPNRPDLNVCGKCQMKA